MARTALRRICFAAFAVLILTGCGVLIAAAATGPQAKRTTTAGAPKAKQLKFACAHPATGTMRYVPRLSRCRSSERRLTISTSRAPIDVCVKLHGTRNGVRGSLGQLRAARRLPAGTTRWVDDPANCRPPTQPNQAPVMLPDTRQRLFCARRSDGRLRWVSRRSRCSSRREIVLFVPKGPGRPTPPTPPAAPPEPPAVPRNAPVANADSASTNEDTARIIDVRANDSDADGDAFAVSSIDTAATAGSATLKPDGTIEYDPNGNFDDLAPGSKDTDTFTYKVRDGDGESAAATVTVEVDGRNDAPQVTPGSGSPTYAEHAAPVVVDSGLLLTDADSAGLDEAKVAITGGFVNGDTLEADLTGLPAITGTYDSGTGVLTLTGTASVADYRQALRTVSFESPVSDDPGASRTIEFSATDDTGDEGDPLARNLVVEPVNDAPANTVPAGLTTDEDTTKTLSGAEAPSVDDPDSGGSPIKITLTAANGSLDLDGTTGPIVTFTGSRTAVNDALDGLKLVPAQDFSGTASIELVTDDQGNTGSGGNQTDTDSFDIAVGAVNDAPVNTVPGAQAVNEDGSLNLVGAFSVADADAGPNDLTTSLSLPDSVIDVDHTSTATVTGDVSSSVQITGTVSEINDALDNVGVTPNPNTDNDRTLTMTTDDGGNTGPGGAQTDTDTVTIDVTPVNDAPTVDTSPGSASFTEDDATGVVVDPAVTVADVDDTHLESATVQITTNRDSATDELTFADQNGITHSWTPATGTLELTGHATKADYETALRSIRFKANGHDPSGATRTVTFKAGDGDDESATDSRDVTVAPVNDPPTVDTTDSNASFTEGQAGAIEIDDGIQVADADDTNLASATVEITSGHQSSDVLALPTAPPAGVTVNHVAGTDTLTITGTATVAEYQALLRDVTFHTPSLSPGASRTITFQVNDGTTNNPATNDMRLIDVTNINDAPVIGNLSGSVAYTEDDPGTVIDGDATVTDNDSANLAGGTITITNFKPGDELVDTPEGPVDGTYNSGDGVLTISGAGTPAQYQTFVRNVRFRNTTDTPDTTDRSIEFQVDDGEPTSNLSNVATKTVNVTAVNDAPVVTATGGPSSFTEDQSTPTVVDSGVTVTDADSLMLSGATVTVGSGTFQSGADVLALNPSPQNGITGTYNSVTGVLTLSGSASVGDYQTALQSVTYSNTSQAPSTTPRLIDFQVDDGAALNNLSNVATKTLNVAAVNDPPVNTVPGAQTIDEDADLTFSSANGNLISVADGDAGAGDIKTTLEAVNGTLTLGSTPAGLAVTGDGSDTVELTGTQTEINTALSGLKYRGDLNYFGAETLTVTTSDLGLTPPPAEVDSDNVAITVNPVNDAPTAVNDTFNGAESAVGNTTLAVSTSPSGPKKTIVGNLLTDDTDSTGSGDDDSDIDGPGPLVVADETKATADGGTVDINPDGSFTYVNDAADNCGDPTDTFTYTVSDQNGTGPGPTPGTATGIATIAVAGCVWYVDDNGPGNSGTSQAPFDALSSAEAKSVAGQTVYVHAGSYTGGFTLDPNERLIGEAANLVVGSDTLHTGAGANRPTLTDAADDVVVLASGNTVRGLGLEPQGSGGLAGGSGDTSGTIDDVRVIDTGAAGSGPGFELLDTAGTWDVSNLTVDNSAASSPPSTAIGVRLNDSNGAAAPNMTTNFASAGTISVTTKGAKGLDAAGTSMGSGPSTFDDITVTGSGSGGVSLTNTTGSTSFGGGAGTVDLALTTTSGTTPAFDLDNAGTVNVDAADVDNVSANGGPAIDVTGTSAATLNFDDVDSTGSATDGINLDGTGGWTFSATSGDIGGHTGIAVDVNGGSGAVSYPGTIANSAGGRAVDVTGRSGNTTISGNITGSGGTGINVSGNSSPGTTTFSGTTKKLDTGANQAVTLGSNSGHTVAFTSGGLDIDTSSGAGFGATGGGVVSVTGSGNTIDSASATGLRVANTTIGASGLTFQSVSSGNNTAAADPANGIVLDNTGATAGLTVTGNGSANSGGTIQNTSSHGITLTSTRSVSLDRMNIQNTAGSGVRGTTAVNGFSFTNGTINNSGTGGGNQDSNIAFNDPTGSATDAKVTGTVTITGNTLTNARWHGVSILQFDGTITDANISNNTLTSGTTTGTGGNSLGSGIQLFVGGTASAAANVTRAELNGNTITNFPGGVLMALQSGTSNGSGPTTTYGTPGSATNDIEVKDNILNGGGTSPDGAGGFIKPNQLILATVNGRGQGNFNIQDNGTAADPLSGSAGNIIDISAGGNVTAQATVSGNRIDAADQTVGGTSGIAAGVGSFDVTGPVTLGNSKLYATIQNNNVVNSAGTGVRLNVNNGTPGLFATVTGNTVGAPLGGTYGIQVVQGPDGTKTTELAITGNASAGGTDGTNTWPGIGLRKKGTTVGEFGIVGLSPSPATNTQMEASVAAQNPSSASGTFGTGGVAAVNGSSSNWTSIASVDTP